jgi:hypothetical protein
MATLVQQGQQCQHDKNNDATIIRAMMPAQPQRGWQCHCNWQCQHDESQCQRDKGNNPDEVVNATIEYGYNYLRLLLYANGQHINVLKHLLMSNMDAESSLRWPSTSTLT